MSPHTRHALVASTLLLMVSLIVVAGGEYPAMAGDDRGSPMAATERATTEPERPTITPLPTDPPRATTEPTATTPPRATEAPTATATTVPSPPTVPANIQPAPPPQYGTLVTLGRVCPESFKPVKAGGSPYQYQSECTGLPFETWHYAEHGTTHTTGSALTSSSGGQPVSYSLKSGPALTSVSTVDGFIRMAAVCASPSQAPTKVTVSPHAAVTISPQQTTTCTWYFKPTATPGTISVGVWQCPDGFVLDDYEEMLVTCTEPVANVWIRVNDGVDKDLDYEAQTAGDGTVTFTAVWPNSYSLFFWPGSWNPPLATGTTMLGSCVPDVYHGMNIANPKVGWFTVPAGGAVTCNVWIIPPG